ncbi:MAG: hypothetical protein BIFFINMI_03861 [Phycisphaerae bacterium]|nr:hypothetical protein [Phycisphaerae bacterium]
MVSEKGEYVIQVPRQHLAGAARDMRAFLAMWDWRWKLPRRTSGLLLDFTRTTFVEPWALSMFTAYALTMGDRLGIPVRALLSPSNPSNVYTEYMGIREVLETGRSTKDWDDSRQNTGLHVIRSHDDVTRFFESAKLLGHGANQDTLNALKYSMLELGRNVVQHSASPVGGVAIAQYFPDREGLQIAVCDCGQGVFHALSHAYSELGTDLEGLKLAVLPHVSGAFREGTYSGSDNAGLGLFFSKEIGWRSGGSFWLLSGNSLLGVVGEDASAKDRIYRRTTNWQGTCVTIDMPAWGVEDFSSLLEVCRALAASARKESGPAALDFINSLPEGDDTVEVIVVKRFAEDVGKARDVRVDRIIPGIKERRPIVLDFAGVSFATQSFVHALLNDAFEIPGSLLRLSFLNTTRPTEESIRLVAAYAASYRQSV